MSTLKKRVSLFVIFGSYVMFWLTLTQPVAAQGNSNDLSQFICEELQASMQHDPELAKLTMKYAALLQDQSITEEKLAELISSEDSDKAQLLGIQIRFSGGAQVEGPDGLSLCWHPPVWTSGTVRWNFANPAGSGYSVLPEGGGHLNWAAPPEQAIDGIYRRAWGGCNAYKIPNSATATFFNANDWEVCYNVWACEIGNHCPKWVNPCNNASPEHDWPDSPL